MNGHANGYATRFSTSQGIGPARLLTVGGVAEMLQVHPNTVRHWADWGYLPSFRIGPRGDRRFRYEDVAALLPKVGVAS